MFGSTCDSKTSNQCESIKLTLMEPFNSEDPIVSRNWMGTGLCADGQVYLSVFFENPIDLIRFCLTYESGDFVIDWKNSTAKIKKSDFDPRDLNIYIDICNIPNDYDRSFVLHLPTFIKNVKDWTEELKQETLKYKEECTKLLEVKRQVKQKDCKEFVFESRLEAFLQVNDIYVERQVRALDRILDLWIPGQLIIECKAGKVSGNDACQAIDYLATFGIDILLIGTGMSRSAERAIAAANKMCSKSCILFVTQEASFNYLKGVAK